MNYARWVRAERRRRRRRADTCRSSSVTFGDATGDAYVVHDWFGHGTDDLLVHNSTALTWQLYCPLTGETDSFTWGQVGGLPVWGKFDGGRTQAASFLDGVWWIKDDDALTYTTEFYGLGGDVPLAGFDGNGDGTDGTAAVRPFWTWFVPDAGADAWGIEGDELVGGPWGTPGVDIPAVWRPSEGNWYLFALDSPPALGTTGDIPVHADWDGDGLLDTAVFRPSNQTWFMSDTSSFVFGTATCTPLPGNFFGAGVIAAYWEDGVFNFR